MQLTITETARQWFEESYPLEEGESIRFFGKLYGKKRMSTMGSQSG